MYTFPVISSILSSAAVAAVIDRQYGQTGTTCSIIKAGVNHTYSIRSAGVQYIFRIYSHNWRSEAEIAEELRLTTHLQTCGINVSYALPDAEGTLIQHMAAPEGLRYGVLFTNAPGEKRFNFTEETHAAAGIFMARLHQLTIGYPLQRISYTTQTLLADPMRQLAAHLPTHTDEMAFMATTMKQLETVLNSADTNAMRHGAVHLDIWFDNMHIDADNSIAVYDFDFCGNGWLCLDVAYYIMQLYVVEPDEQQFRARLAAFLHGYESITPLTAEEKNMLHPLGVCLYFFYLGVQCQRFNDWSNVFINETYLKRYINLRVKKYYELGVLPV